jgi:hypothetical protein
LLAEKASLFVEVLEIFAILEGSALALLIVPLLLQFLQVLKSFIQKEGRV